MRTFSKYLSFSPENESIGTPALSNILLLFILSLLTGCGETRNTGFLKKTFVDDRGDISHYVVYVPPTPTNSRRRPVILFLNGWGENGEDGLRQISNNFGSEVWRMRGHFPFLAVCPQCSPKGNWSPGSPNANKALAILDEAISQYDGDPQRVCVTGASAGGSGALALAASYPEKFASVVPVASSGLDVVQQLASTGIPTWCFYNSRDGVADGARSFRGSLIASGASPLFTEYQRDGHNAWDAAYASPALYQWMLRQNKEGRLGDRYSPITVGRVVTEWLPVGTINEWRIESEDIVASPSSAKKWLSLVSPKNLNVTSVHFDLLLGKEDACKIQILDSDKENNEFLKAVIQLPASGPYVPAEYGDRFYPINPSAQYSLSTGWNDVRIELNSNQLEISLNGWMALREPVRDMQSLERVKISLTSTSRESRIRYLRTQGGLDDD